MESIISPLHDKIAGHHGNICGVEVLKHGKSVLSDYSNGFMPSGAVNVMSVTKSIVALLVGIAVDKGFISSIEQPVLDFFPDYKVKRGEKTLQQVKLRHLLTMTAPYKGNSEPWTKICSSDDWTVGALDIIGGRGGITGEFRYSTLGIHVLMGIIARTSGMRTIDFANDFLFSPLGIALHTNYEAQTEQEHKEFVTTKLPHENVWFTDPKGVNTAGWGLCMTPADMAKIGQLCLNKGVVEEKRILSGEWIDRISTPSSPKMQAYGGMSYGLLWWIVDVKRSIYAASGLGGNVIYIHPELDVVVAVAATFKPTVFDRIPFIEKYVLPFIS